MNKIGNSQLTQTIIKIATNLNREVFIRAPASRIGNIKQPIRIYRTSWRWLRRIIHPRYTSDFSVCCDDSCNITDMSAGWRRRFIWVRFSFFQHFLPDVGNDTYVCSGFYIAGTFWSLQGLGTVQNWIWLFCGGANHNSAWQGSQSFCNRGSHAACSPWSPLRRLHVSDQSEDTILLLTSWWLIYCWVWRT